ncbi:MAG: biotin--[acetyl-CoA-carboxylase] ligase [Bacteroidetes bacterium]|nr:biotin--[acetyl-CoA-carboxylase] ligase [Bacteroidota bacterium]
MSTLFIGTNTIRLPIVESTNTYAQELLKDSTAPEGTIVITDQQSLGRGQRGNTWLSEAGKNLTFSLILYPPSIGSENQFILTQLVSLGIAECIEQVLAVQHSVKIKWPNDIFVNDKKIAGVLIENAWRNNSISSSIVGIGLNVNQETFELLHATSLKIETQIDYNLNELFTQLCSCIEARYLQLKSSNFAAIKADYHMKLYRLNQYHHYTIYNKQAEGKIIGVNKEGKLLLALKEDFNVLELDLKEVKFNL